MIIWNDPTEAQILHYLIIYWDGNKDLYKRGKI